jgi:hypothetical protein
MTLIQFINIIFISYARNKDYIYIKVIFIENSLNSL